MLERAFAAALNKWRRMRIRDENDTEWLPTAVQVQLEEDDHYSDGDSVDDDAGVQLQDVRDPL